MVNNEDYTRIEIIMNPYGSLPLSKHPQKDGTETIYECGVVFHGSWASRLEQHERFCKTPIGKYILYLENK